MIVVERLFPGTSLATEVWVSESVKEAIAQYALTERTQGEFLKKLNYWANRGFASLEGRGCPIRHEWDGIYRVGMYATLFRIYGFYEGARKAEFIAVTSTTKREQRLRPADKNQINEASRIKTENDWHRMEE